MNISITINDMTSCEAADLLDKLNSDGEVVDNGDIAVIAGITTFGDEQVAGGVIQRRKGKEDKFIPDEAVGIEQHMSVGELGDPEFDDSGIIQPTQVVEAPVASVLPTPVVEAPVVEATLTQSDNPVELDPSGIPWDSRIHSGGKTKSKKGFWVKKRGLSDTVYDAVVLELQNLQDNPPIHSDDGTLDVAAFKARNNIPDAAMGAIAPTPVVAAPTLPPVPLSTTTPPARDFAGLLAQLNALGVRGDTNPEHMGTIISRINTGFGTEIVALTDIADKENMVEYAWQCLDADGKAA